MKTWESTTLFVDTELSWGKEVKQVRLFLFFTWWGGQEVGGWGGGGVRKARRTSKGWLNP